MYSREKAECPYCEGEGEVMDGRRVHARCIDPPMTTCPECRGSGEIYAEDADDIDTDRTLSDYEEDDRWDAAEARWERENDR